MSLQEEEPPAGPEQVRWRATTLADLEVDLRGRQPDQVLVFGTPDWP